VSPGRVTELKKRQRRK